MERKKFLTAIRRMGFRKEREHTDSMGHKVVVYYRKSGYIPLDLKINRKYHDTYLAERLDVHHDSKVVAYFESGYKKHRNTFFYDKLSSISGNDVP